MVEKKKGVNAMTAKIDVKINFLLNSTFTFDRPIKVNIAKIYGMEVGRVK